VALTLPTALFGFDGRCVDWGLAGPRSLRVQPLVQSSQLEFARLSGRDIAARSLGRANGDARWTASNADRHRLHGWARAVVVLGTAQQRPHDLPLPVSPSLSARQSATGNPRCQAVAAWPGRPASRDTRPSVPRLHPSGSSVREGLPHPRWGRRCRQRTPDSLHRRHCGPVVELPAM